MTHRGTTGAARAALLLLLTAGCAGPVAHAAAPTTPAARPCRAAGEAVLPHTAGTLTQADGGARICLRTGQQVAVLLHSPATDPAGRWQPIEIRPGGRVRRGDSRVMTPSVGTTTGLFTATAAGETELTSRQASGAVWHLTLVVS
ncbi:hypothetical protein P3T36_001029 [Kitasatospora sp. MAP12-15]|uniref:hypothetical protein n=1 Tax=unclassified Kitasatospora TaxID=2633591 RepID=UPI002473F229|nr:hypothetical protein [Kitasatospora sp. MAP12-44]MDH6114677.1 hypothetical protein [Kitasatospora sp. MAP12-44]